MTLINWCRVGYETWRFVPRDDIVTRGNVNRSETNVTNPMSHYLLATTDLLPLRLALKILQAGKKLGIVL